MATKKAILCKTCKVVHLLTATDTAPEYNYNPEEDTCVTTPKDDLQAFRLKHQKHQTAEVSVE